MALIQPNSAAVWSEESGSGLAFTPAYLKDFGTHYGIVEFAGAGTPDAILLDLGNDAYETVETSVNVDGDPELILLSIGSAAIITVEQ